MKNANCSTVCDIFSLWFLFTVFLGFPRVTRVLTKNVGLFIRTGMGVRGVLGNKCAGHHNLKTVKVREMM